MKLASILVATAGVGLAGYALSVHFGSGDSGPVAEVVTLPQKPTTTAAIEPPRPVPAEPPKKVVAVPGDRASLARELQRELKRVGCYSGEVNGQWTTSSRMAMKSFTDRVNATLPIDAPDYILLSLVQKHEGKACGINCPSGQTLTDDGRCAPSAVLAKAGEITPPEPKPAERPGTGTSTVTALAPTAGQPTDMRGLPYAGTAVAPKREPIPTPSTSTIEEKTRTAAKIDREPDPEIDEQTERRRKRVHRSDGPVPEVGVYEDRPRKRYAKSKPPKVVRKFLRNLQRSLAGLPF